MTAIDQDNMINYRFSRRLGEQVPDATYAQGWEGPGETPLTIAKAIFWSVWIAAVLAVGSLALALAFAA